MSKLSAADKEMLSVAYAQLPQLPLSSRAASAGGARRLFTKSGEHLVPSLFLIAPYSPREPQTQCIFGGPVGGASSPAATTTAAAG